MMQCFRSVWLRVLKKNLSVSFISILSKERFRSDWSSEKQSLKIEKKRGPKQTGGRPVGGHLFFQFLKDCFFLNSVPGEHILTVEVAESLVFINTPLVH